MVKLLECQKEELPDPEEESYLYYLVTHVLFRVLDIMESDLTPNERLDIKAAIKDWSNPKDDKL